MDLLNKVANIIIIIAIILTIMLYNNFDKYGTFL